MIFFFILNWLKALTYIMRRGAESNWFFMVFQIYYCKKTQQNGYKKACIQIEILRCLMIDCITKSLSRCFKIKRIDLDQQRTKFQNRIVYNIKTQHTLKLAKTTADSFRVLLLFVKCISFFYFLNLQKYFRSFHLFICSIFA